MSCCHDAWCETPPENQLGRRAALKWLALAGGAAVVPTSRATGQGRDGRRVRLAFCGQLL